jgi:hypothetical protein
MSIVYVTVGVVEKTHPPVIGAFRSREKAERRSADGVIYPVSDPTESILGAEDGMCFDDRDSIYPQLHAVVRGHRYEPPLTP